MDYKNPQFNQTFMTIQNLDDPTIVKQIQQDNFSNLEILLNRHSGIYQKLARKIAPSGHLAQEVKDDCSSVLFEAAQSYDFNKGTKFSTWAYNISKYHIFDILSDNKGMMPEESDYLNRLIDGDYKINHEIERNKASLELVKDVLDQIHEPRMKKVIKLRYFSGPKVKTYQCIGDELGFSHQTAKIICDKFTSLCREKLESHIICDNI